MSTGFLRRAWPTSRLGIALGCLASLVGSIVFALVVVSTVCFLAAWHSTGSSQYGGFWLGFWLFVAIGSALGFACAVVPGSLGGGIIAVALCALGRRTRSLATQGTLIGGVVGLMALILTLLVDHVCFAALSLFLDPMFAWLLLVAAAIAIAAGARVGRRLARSAGERVEQAVRAAGGQRASRHAGGEHEGDSPDAQAPLA